MKNNTADIVTILSQANGKVTLMLENLLARAADASDYTWLDRFAATTYDDLVYDTGMFPTDAEAELSRLYSDDAKKDNRDVERFQRVPLRLQSGGIAA